MKKTYYVCKYYEAYEDHYVEAESEEQAKQMVMEGKSDAEDVTIKESEIVKCSEDKE
jgi:hypothetical protein